MGRWPSCREVLTLGRLGTDRRNLWVSKLEETSSMAIKIFIFKYCLKLPKDGFLSFLIYFLKILSMLIFQEGFILKFVVLNLETIVSKLTYLLKYV